MHKVVRWDMLFVSEIELRITVISHQLKEASVKDANATPPTIGTREETTQRVGLCVHSNQQSAWSKN